MVKVALITVNYNGLKDTLEFLESLQKLDTKDLEVKTIVVDNGSFDSSVPKISEKFPKIDLVQTGSNKGFTGGFNKGLEYGGAWGADYFLLINNDTEIGSSDLLKSLIKTLEKNSNAGLVAPKIYFAKGYEYQKNYEEKDLGKVIWYGGGSFDWDNVMSKHIGIDEVDSGKYDEIKETGFISGCCFLMKKEVIEKVGGFDEKLFAYFEDNDFLQRVKSAGFQLFYNGKVFIYHKVSQTAEIGSEFADYFVTRNRLTFGFKYAKTRTKFALLRQSLGFLITGRKMQKRGVWDFFLQKKEGEKKLVKINSNPDFPKKLSIVIVNYNTKDLTEKLLESIYQNKLCQNFKEVEVVLLDNGTLDCCEEMVKKFKEVKYFKNLENLGFSKGYNRVIKYSTGQYILMLNSDIEILDNSVEEILKVAEEKNEKAVLGGKLYFPDKSSQDSCFFLPTISGAFKEYFLNKKGTYFMFVPKSDSPSKVEGLIMACFLIPRKVIDRVGYLDEGTFIFFEDIEYCRRLRDNNIPIYFCPKAEFIHHHGASHKKLKEGEAYKMLVKGSKHYHGIFYYSLLYLVILFGQKFRKIIY
ncbi:MAG: glycosyltransferase family 2 protein [Candidatus Daviesbacteria bacterium]|nr:glycosyltransferase family 2 protein [Candidatus Daviesbacteria bacterium]